MSDCVVVVALCKLHRADWYRENYIASCSSHRANLCEPCRIVRDYIVGIASWGLRRGIVSRGLRRAVCLMGLYREDCIV